MVSLRKLFIFLMLALLSTGVFAEGTPENDSAHHKFQFDKFLLHHVSDSYSWHIITIHRKGKEPIHISIYLPVILRTSDGQWVTFCSKKIPEEENKIFEVKGKKFVVEEEGIYSGKIMEVLEDGTRKRPFDISFTKDVLALFIASFLMIFIFIPIANRYKKYPNKPPKGLQSALEPLILFVIDDVAKSSIGKKYEKYTPFLLSVFFFIFFNNLMGLIPIFPGGYNLTGNITITLVLALFTFIITTFSGNRHYWQHIFWSPIVPVWLKVPIPLMPLVEIIGMFTKPFVLMVRLFANIIGGHFVLLSFIGLIFVFGQQNIYLGYGTSIISILFSLFVSLIELLVAFIQAYVFTFLSALYFGMAVEEEH